MPIKDRKELFLTLLSDALQSTERSSQVFQEMSQGAKDPRIKEALEARSFVSSKIVGTLNECFKLLGEQPTKTSGRIHDIFAEDFRKMLSEIQQPEARHLFILAKLNQLIHLRIGEFVALTAAADMTGNYGVGVLLESCLADKIALAERTRRLIRNIVEGKVAERLAA